MRRIALAAVFLAVAMPAAQAQLMDVLTAPKTLIDRAIEARSASDIAKDNMIVVKVNGYMGKHATIKASTEIYEQRLLITGLLLFQIFGQRDNTQKARDGLLNQFQSERKSRVIALIHRQESQSVFGVQVAAYINIEDSEAVLRAIRLTPDDQPIDLILHTPGGLVLAAEQIARALADHKGKGILTFDQVGAELLKSLDKGGVK